MADTGIDFGQTSAPKYSLRWILNKQETALPIARDMAQAIQVADNAFKGYSQIEEEASSARYYNAVTDFNNLKAQQQDEIGQAGVDLNAQRAVLDKYKPMMDNLSNKYTLSEKHTAQLGSSIEGHNSGWEEKYRGAYNAQQDGIAQTNIAEVASTLVDVPQQDAAITMQALKEYYKTMTGTDDRTAGVTVAKNYANAKIASINTDSMSFGQMGAVKNELLETLKSADPKITTSSLYKDVEHGMSVLTEKARRLEEDRIEAMVRLGDVPSKTMNSVVDDARKRGILLSDEKSQLLKSIYSDKLLDKQAKADAAVYRVDSKAAQVVEWQIAAGNYAGMTKENIIKKLDSDPRFSALIPEHKDALVAKAMKDTNTEQIKALKAHYTDLVGYLENNKTNIDSEGVTYTTANYEHMLRTLHDGGLSADQQKKIQVFNIQALAATDVDYFAKQTPTLFGTNAPASKEVADNMFDKVYTSNNPNRIRNMALLSLNYGVNGSISGEIGSQYRSNFNGVYQDYIGLKESVPNNYKSILGEKNVEDIELMSKLMREAKVSQPTPSMYEQVEKARGVVISLADPIHRDSSRRLSDYISRNDITDFNSVKKEFISSLKLGMGADDAIKSIDKRRQALEVAPNINVKEYGQDLSKEKKQQLIESLDFLKRTKGNVIESVVYNPATGSMWLGTNTNPHASDTGLSLQGWVNKTIEDKLVYESKRGKLKPVPEVVNKDNIYMPYRILGD